MFTAITQDAHEAAIASLVPISGGDLFSGGTFLEHGLGGVAMYRVERVGNASRFYEFVPTTNAKTETDEEYADRMRREQASHESETRQYFFNQ